MPSREGIIILPKPEDSSLYYIFHYSAGDTLHPVGGYESLNLYYSIADMRLDSGRGAVTAKNVPIIQNELLSYSRMAACRHANGRDWWIVKNAYSSNRYYVFLLDPQGVHGPYIQDIGPGYGTISEHAAYATFSQDGTKYASATTDSYIVLLDFDRCSGSFSNPDSIYNNDLSDPINFPNSGALSLAFSPNGRFLYVLSYQNILNQYDLLAARLNDSIQIYRDTDFYEMNIIQQAPNDKLYISCYNGGSYKIHVINQPDSLGLACDFHALGQRTLALNTNAIPYFPNFRLGALSGSACDTLTAIDPIASHSLGTRIYPSPATDVVQIDLYSRDLSEPLSWVMYDMLGHEMLRKEIPLYQIQVPRNNLASGLYTWQIQNGNGQTKANGKLVWQ